MLEKEARALQFPVLNASVHFQDFLRTIFLVSSLPTLTHQRNDASMETIHEVNSGSGVKNGSITIPADWKSTANASGSCHSPNEGGLSYAYSKKINYKSNF